MLSSEFAGRAAAVGYSDVGMPITSTSIPAASKIASANPFQLVTPWLAKWVTPNAGSPAGAPAHRGAWPRMKAARSPAHVGRPN